ncbi:hypothetical protein CUMW_169120 [Citrus unshiu]|uniref:WAT1-related protein n=1 Tax=Citrus unshiu TaxID=55188 RepID=A0A2H5PUP6_CITUN|nr:hypothetical protein CUMW_169120 [Citrus unshiu]
MKCINMEAYSPYVAMILVQFAYGGSNILVKISLEKGLNHLVFVVYRHVLAMVLLGPFAYVLERKHRPKLSFAVMAKIFVLALFGATIHLNVYYTGFSYVSPTVATALSNVIPSFTFLLAFLLGMEKVKITSGRGGAKVLGTIVCIGGSLIFTFWKRGCLLKGFVQKPLIHIYDTDQLRHHGNENWFKGSALILTSHISWSAWLILLATVSKDYPAPLSLNALICFFASLQSSFVALFLGRNPTLWKLDWNGVINSALLYYLQTWCISVKGPVFSAMFSPLQLVIVALFSAIAFAERLHLDSLIGAFLIVVGLYCVLWGKKKDRFAVDEQKEDRNGTGDDKV